MDLYGLYSKKKDCLMGFSVSANEGDMCEPVTFTLSSFSTFDYLWVTPSKGIAEKVANSEPTDWYNASHETPDWDDYVYGTLEVVCLNEWEKDKGAAGGPEPNTVSENDICELCGRHIHVKENINDTTD